MLRLLPLSLSELKNEGLARDLVRAVQRLRKEIGLEFTDMVHLAINGVDDIMKTHGDLIANETNAILKENDGEEVSGVVNCTPYHCARPAALCDSA